jgi:hypothetical protein
MMERGDDVGREYYHERHVYLESPEYEDSRRERCVQGEREPDSEEERAFEEAHGGSAEEENDDALTSIGLTTAKTRSVDLVSRVEEGDTERADGSDTRSVGGEEFYVSIRLYYRGMCLVTMSINSFRRSSIVILFGDDYDDECREGRGR